MKEIMSGLRLHHLGVATRSIEKELFCYEALGYSPCSGIFTDERQGIRGLFISAPGQPDLELLENLNGTGPLDDYLKRGVKIYHFAYETPCLEDTLEKLSAACKARVVVPVMQADYFSRLCFVMLPNMLLVELVQVSAG